LMSISYPPKVIEYSRSQNGGVRTEMLRALTQ
jgi:hypothetical protein